MHSEGVEPSVDSRDKDERILARRLRIQNRREAAQREILSVRDDESDTKEEVDNLLKQIKNSQRLLQKMKVEGFEMIGQIRTDLDSNEIRRRVAEEEAQKMRKEKLSNDKEVTLDKFEEITKKWQNATTEDNAYKLKEMLDKQREACNSLLQSKDQLLEELKNVLKEKDQEYVNELKRQADDVTQLSVQMNNQVDVLGKSYKKQLQQIESVFVKEIEATEAGMEERWNKLLQDRVMKEAEYMKNRDIQTEVNERLLNEQKVRDSEEYNSLNIKLEKNIQELQQQIQEMQVTFQMNQEKLEYNFQVLRKRDEENFLMKSVQKKTIKRLNDQLSIFKKKAEAQENNLVHTNSKILEDYKFLIKRFRILLEKAQQTIGCNLSKYQAVWQMNEEECRRMARRILDVNMVLYQQQLCLPWTPPDLPFVEDERGVMERINAFTHSQKMKEVATKRVKINEKETTRRKKRTQKKEKVEAVDSAEGAEVDRGRGKSSVRMKEVKEDDTTDDDTSRPTGAEAKRAGNSRVEFSFFERSEVESRWAAKSSVFTEKRVKEQFEEDYFYEEIKEVDECLDLTPPTLVKHVFQLICDETGFLLQDKVWSLLNSLRQNDQTLMKLDSVFSVMQIEDEKDIKTLSKYFLKHGTKNEYLEAQKQVILEENLKTPSKQEIEAFLSPYAEEEDVANGDDRPTTAAERVDDDEDGAEKEAERSLGDVLIKPNDVLLALKTFVDENVVTNNAEVCQNNVATSRSEKGSRRAGNTNVKKLQEMMAVLPKPLIDDVLMKHNLYNLYNDTELTSRKRGTTHDGAYWQQYADINAPYQKMWDALEVNFFKYYKVLMDREKLIDRRNELLKQNAEYQKLINYCKKDGEKLPEIRS